MKTIENMYEIDFKGLKRGQQFLMMDEITEDREGNEYPDPLASVSHILFDKEFCGIYRFHTHETYPEISFDESDGEMFVDFIKSEIYDHFIIVKDKPVKLQEDCKSITNPGRFGETQNVIKIINLLKDNNKDSFYIREFEGKFVKDIVAVKLSDELTLGQVMENTIEAETFTWRTNISTYLVHKDGDSACLGNSKNIMDSISRIIEDNEHIEQFNLLRKICNGKYGNYKQDYVDIVKQFFVSGDIKNEDIDTFYSPFYEDEELNLKFYITGSGYMGNRYCMSAYRDGKYVGWSDMAEQYPEKRKIINAIFEFINNRYSGISPFDGLYHMDRDKIKDEVGMFYHDFRATRYWKNNKMCFYINTNGYYLENTDKEEIEAAEERENMMKTMAAAPAITIA